MRIAVLTGGGARPGLNAVIRAVVRRAQNHRFEVMGLRDGWKGLIEDRVFPLTRENTAGILHRGGTILGTSRVNPFTIDNDLNGTDYTFGFDTAVSIATEAIDRLHSTAESHKRVIVVEVMGRHVGWIATHAGIAGGADVILVPEEPADLAAVAEQLKRRYASGTSFSIVVVAEGTKIRANPDEPEHVVTSGALDEAGRVRLGGVGQYVAQELERRTGFETRVSVLGHIQRGGSPTAHDRVLASRFGVHACDMVARGEFGRMAALRGNEVTSVPLVDAIRTLKRVPAEYFDVARVFFG